MDLFIQIFQVVLMLSILVVLHEFGHFIPAKLFKTKVEKFYLFFDPWFSLFKKKIGETEYGIGWLPFGGYVKIAGMIDESMDTDQMKKEPQPWEFRSKPAWQRLIIMLGGITVNVILAWVIYSCLSFFNGEQYHSLSKFQYGIQVSEEGAKMGLQNGDKILKIDGKKVDRFETSIVNMLWADNVTVLRNGKETTFNVNEDGIADILKKNQAKLYFSPRNLVTIDTITSETAKKADIKVGDRVVGVNGKSIRFYDELTPLIKASKNQPISLDILRNNQLKKINLTVPNDGEIGIGTNANAFDKSVITQKYTFLQAIPRGLQRSVDVLTMQIKQFKIIFSSKVQGYKSVSGPIGIVKAMPKTLDWNFFWSFTAMFSVWLAFLNLLPIPGLDGGHALFTIVEMITGKTLNDKAMGVVQTIGMMILLGLMVLIFGKDIYEIFFPRH